MHQATALYTALVTPAFFRYWFGLWWKDALSLLILFSLTETITSSFPFRGYLAGCGTLVADQVRGEKMD